MLRTSDSFTSIAHSTLAMTPVGKLLETSGAVVLERIARGGGATNWYSCSGQSQLEMIEARLLPGSVVSFYFDERIRLGPLSPLRSRGE
jgi:hypothetical protein